MSKNTKLLKLIPLSTTQEGVISISQIDEPYAKGSPSVASIGVSLDGDVDNPEWKVHIPLTDLNAVIEALNKIETKA